MFIVLEGIDGSGKTTQLHLLKNHFESIGKTVKVFDFPRYSEGSSFFVQKFLNGQYKEDLSSQLISTFFALDRFDASEELKESLQKYDFVISNRYVSSNLIHQSAKIMQKKGIDFFDQEILDFIAWVQDFEYNICKITEPDRVLFLDVPPDITQHLIEKKDQRSYIKIGNKDINESDIEHQKKSYKSALLLVNILNWEYINCFENGKLLSPEIINSNCINKLT